MSKRIIEVFLIKFIVLFAILGIGSARGDFHLIELKEMSIGYKSFFPKGYDPMLQGDGGVDHRQLGKQVNLFFNIDIAKHFYFNNRVHGTTDEILTDDGHGTGKGQFRKVGWNFQVGFRPTSIVDIEYEHHSQHMLDWNPGKRFPVEDSIGFKLHIYRSPEPSTPIF